ncbi:hypothetical protein Pcinc_015410 [Petrolisthes cinctipes]|uniref:CCHC-type domain-containing protein n=1 Tax=Petrolisthes cinctipes TaxID=88211 RepID=A0AAE1KN56_PETCI|nr:hypothetical protein Pcinc_015410 [Petrolisthes cinctipes]
MEKFLRPEKFEGREGTTSEQWTDWYHTFTNFLDTIEAVPDSAKLKLLINYVSPVFSYISECTRYSESIKVLEAVFMKPPNEIFARYKLATRKQQSSETIDQYLQSLKLLAKDCSFKAVTADLYSQEAVRDAFITGLTSSLIRKRLLEKPTLTLEEAVQQARSLEMAQVNAEMYASSFSSNNYSTVTAVVDSDSSPSYASKVPEEENEMPEVAATKSACSFCGRLCHPRYLCPARKAICHKCGKRGHFSSVCRSKVRPEERSSIKESAMILSSLTLARHPLIVLVSVS